MRSRWFHTPVLHTGHGGPPKKPTWLELFYDLVFVAAFIQLGNGLSANATGLGVLGFAAVFVTLWVAWTGLTYYSNRFEVDDFTHRILVITQMFSVGAMALYAPMMLEGRVMAFSLAYACAQLIVALMYARTFLRCSEGHDYSRYWGGVFLVGAVVWAVAAFLPAEWAFALQGVGVLVVIVSPLSRQSRELQERLPSDHEHLAERYGLLTLIVLGESFVKVLTGLSPEEASLGILGQASLSLLVTVCVWWIYFDDVAGSHLRRMRLASTVWLFGHLPMQLGVTAVGVGIKKAVHLDLIAAPDAKTRWLLCGALALTFASCAVIDSVTERRQAELSDRARVNMRGISALAVLLLAPAGAGMSGAVFLGLVAAVCVAQVAFDLMMAPFEGMSDEALERLPTTGAPGAPRMPGLMPTGSPRSLFNAAVRAGTPSELRSDLFHYFIDGPWSRLFVAAASLYLLGNLFFASLYLMEPGSVAQAAPQSFADAFFFSVQTMTTIGYGHLHPGNLWGNAIVTLEAATGLAAVALSTGVMLAKASRPQASVLFSQRAVLVRRGGVPTLMLRVGNARGTEIVDANLTLSVLKDEVSPEGIHLRRLHDLKLVRERTPVFFLTWTVMHEVDEHSPLYGIPPEALGEHIVSLVALFIGHDGSYGQTTYARHIYNPTDIVVGHRFVDVLSQLPDGRALVNYRRFHDTEPLAASEPTAAS